MSRNSSKFNLTGNPSPNAKNAWGTPTGTARLSKKGRYPLGFSRQPMKNIYRKPIFCEFREFFFKNILEDKSFCENFPESKNFHGNHLEDKKIKENFLENKNFRVNFLESKNFHGNHLEDKKFKEIFYKFFRKRNLANFSENLSFLA